MPKYLIAPNHKVQDIKMAMGDFITTSAADTVPTGLKQILGFIVSPAEDLADAFAGVSAKASATAGSLTINSWKTDGTDPTPAAATVFGKKVNWIAWGN